MFPEDNRIYGTFTYKTQGVLCHSPTPHPLIIPIFWSLQLPRDLPVFSLRGKDLSPFLLTRE